MQTDNGAEFQSRFHWHLEGLDIRHPYIRPRTPHLNGKVERSHRVDDQEFYHLLDKDGLNESSRRIEPMLGRSGRGVRRVKRNDLPTFRVAEVNLREPPVIFVCVAAVCPRPSDSTRHDRRRAIQAYFRF